MISLITKKFSIHGFLVFLDENFIDDEHGNMVLQCILNKTAVAFSTEQQICLIFQTICYRIIKAFRPGYKMICTIYYGCLSFHLDSLINLLFSPLVPI